MTKCLFKIRARSVALIAAVAGVAGASCVLPAASSAALVATGACDGSALSQPFRQWGDSSQYKLVPGGSFESGTAGWTLRGGAAIVSGGEPFGAGAAHGLYLPASSSVESPATCVNAAYPTFRMFAHSSSTLSTLLVQVVYSVPLLGRVAVPVGAISLSKNWGPSLPMLTASAVTGALKNGVAQVSIRLTALTGGTTIDDVFVDPRLSH